MKKKLIFLGLFLTTVGLLYKFSFQASEVEKIRQQHAEFLKNHPYQKTAELPKKERKSLGLPPNAYFEQKYLSEINPRTGRIHKENVLRVQEELNTLRQGQRVPGDASDNPWIERGPNNVGGRTRAVLFDPNDTTNETVFAGGVSGGLWKNTNISNENSQWVRVGIPENIAVSCIAADPNNSNIFYVGTGESYTSGDANGNGLWKSTDGGNSWAKVFGGATGESYLDFNSQLSISSPAGLVGDYSVVLTSAFGGDITSIASGLILVDDGTDPTEDGCEVITNVSELTGNIAVIRRGTCNFSDKAKKAQDAGAIAVLIVNNVNTAPFNMAAGDFADEVTIPCLMISKEDGDPIINELASGSVTGTLSKVNDNAVNGALVPGIFFINDVIVRNDGGISEVFVAVGESGYPGSVSVGGDSFGVYKSIDGVNFSKLNIPKTSDGNEYEPNNFEIASDNSIYLSTISSFTFSDGGGAIFKSIDGINFVLKHTISNGLRTEIATSPTNANTVYVLAQMNSDTEPVKIFKTEDDFANVSTLPLPNDADTGIPANDFTRGQSGYDLLIKVDPVNEDVVYVGGIDLFKSVDGGQIWNQISKWSTNNNLASLNVSLVHADQHGLAFANPNKILYSNDGGVYISNDAGVTIEARNNNYNTLQFYTVGVAPTMTFAGDEYIIAGAQDNGTQLISQATEGINSSEEVTGGDGAYSFFDQDGSDGYYITNYVFNNIIGLYDIKNDQFFLINREDESNGSFINEEALDSNQNILYSNYSSNSTYSIRVYSNINTIRVRKNLLTNGLLTSSPRAMKVSPFSASTSKLFVGTELGDLIKIENANETNPTWVLISDSNFIGSVSDIEFGQNENEIFVTMHNYGVVSIWYTNDGGSTWLNKEGNLPDIPVKSILQNPLNLNEVIVGTDLGVWKTSNFNDATPSWTQSNNGMSNVPVLDLDLRDDNTVYAATYGRGVFSGQFTAATASVEDVLNGTKDFTVYPTVSNGTFNVFAKNTLGKTNMVIYNINGQEMYKSSLDFNEKDKHEVSINVSPGMYIVNMIDENNKKSSQKIIIK